MKNILLLLVAIALLFTGCDERYDPNKPRSKKKGKKETAFYSRELQLNGYTFSVTAAGDSLFPLITAACKSAGKPLFSKSFTFKGTVLQALAADLDADKIPELYLALREGGGSAMGKLCVFRPGTAGADSLFLPELTGALQKGYLGRDTFFISGVKLMRQFPIFRHTDLAVNPTGGKRTIQYMLNRELGLLFVSNKDEK